MTSDVSTGRVQPYGCNLGLLSGVDHFVDANKMVGLGSGYRWGVEDVVLARHARPFHYDSLMTQLDNRRGTRCYTTL